MTPASLPAATPLGVEVAMTASWREYPCVLAFVMLWPVTSIARWWARSPRRDC